MNNRALVGLFVVLFAIFGGLYFFRDKVNLLGFGSFNFLNSPSPTSASEQAQDTTADGSSSQSTTEGPPAVETVANVVTVSDTKGEVVLAQAPATGTSGQSLLTACTAELFTQNCSTAPQSPVCGHERIVGADGVEGVRSIDYISACYYCHLYSSDGKLALGDQTSYALGYEAGVCNQ